MVFRAGSQIVLRRANGRSGYLRGGEGRPPAAQVLTPPVCPADVLLKVAVLLLHGCDLLLQLAHDLKTQQSPVRRARLCDPVALGTSASLHFTVLIS